MKIVSAVDFPTRFGHFRAIAFSADPAGKEHVAIVHGDVAGKERVPTRLHSECLTGDALGSLRCDCRDQLTAALEAIGKHDVGILLYLRQEGRGIGLANKLRAYALQEHGFDTFEANRLLGFAEDARDYGGAADMLRALGVGSVSLMTNNPSKMDGLLAHGIDVVGRIPLVAKANEHNVRYLDAKERSGHWLKGADDGENGSEAGEARADRGRDLRLHDRAERAAVLVQGRSDHRPHLPRTLEA
ncbi:MAG TPA: GTP cyclohydrolase II [Candidatus Eisenbacteria bacterium]|nr:GTP cyclohydrolase II [Candidatus Eisenbacteria bacterium]